MASVLEGLRSALAPDYEVERELGGGGQGLIFLARDVTLERRVAIKIIRPELATARATERFLREARILAQLRHPSIMPVHRAGEAGGFAYYVMDYCEGQTLLERLARGPLDLRETVRLGRQLLEGLDLVHRAGLVHRDIKPANVFLLGGRAVLGDFGLVVSETATHSAPTEPDGIVPGTPGYTPPEQRAGGSVTARTDLYAVGVVLYEAVTCQRWYAPVPEEVPDWSRVPRALRPVLRRGLAWSPDRRWRDAASFRRALSRAPAWPGWRHLVTAGVVSAGAVLAWVLFPRPSAPAIRIHPLRVQGMSARPALGDSLADLIVSDLTGVPDFLVLGPRDAGRAEVEMTGALRTQGGGLCAATSLHPSRSAPEVIPETCAAGADPVALADSLARIVRLKLWTDPTQFITDLPRSALPGSQRGVEAWLQAERLFTQGRWGEAYYAYHDAQGVDTTCWLCAWRLFWVENWQGLAHDTAQVRRFLTHLGRFPPKYRSVMLAGTLPTAERLDTLYQVTQRYPQFFFGWWFYGEEQFHRAPLIGHRRHDALESFVHAAQMSPGFAPGWEHLAFLATAEGDSAIAGDALERWRRIIGEVPRDRFSLELYYMLFSSFAWRFHPGKGAQQLIEEALRQPEMRAAPDLAAGPRMLLMFDAPSGAVWVGGRFARMGALPDLAKSGLLAQVLGYMALGAPDSARARLDDLTTRFPEPEWTLFAAEYAGALAYLDSAAVPGWREGAEAGLRRVAESRAGSPLERDRAAGMLAMLSGATLEEDIGDFGRLLEGVNLARQRRWRDALSRTAGLEAHPDAPPASPVLRALTHLERADWWARSGDAEAAARELRWAEHWQVDGFPRGVPQAADVDWSLHALARWRLATILDHAGRHDEEVCLAYVRVANAWSGGSPVFQARADSARRRAAALNCPAAL